MSKVTLEVLENRFTIHRLKPGAPVPDAVFRAAFYWIGRTDAELSVVCDESIALSGVEKSTGWACLRAAGPIDFTVTGVLAGISAALAAAKISIFALSTYDTDYILVPAARLEEAKKALQEGGYRLSAF